MATVSELAPWIFGVATLAVALYFGLKQLEERRESQKFRRIMSSYLKANTRLGQEVSLGTGQTGQVVELPNGEFSVNFILTAEPGVYQVKGSPAALASSERQQEEE